MRRRAAVAAAVLVTPLVVLVAAAAFTFIVHESRPQEQLEKPPPGETRIYVDSQSLLGLTHATVAMPAEVGVVNSVTGFESPRGRRFG